MDKELVAHIVELVKMELRNSADADVASSATGMLRLELVVHQCLMEMGRQVVHSGTVESACKNVAAARMNGSGMTWTLNGAQHMLQLRASITSGRFARDHQHSLPGPPQPAELLAAA